MPKLNNMFANHIAEANGSFEPQRQNNAILQIFLPASVGLGAEGDKSLVLSLDSFPIPKASNTEVEAMYLNESRKFAGRFIYDSMSVVYRDYCDISTADILCRWRHQVGDPWTGRIGLARNYKASAMLSVVAPDGLSYVRHWKCIGVWPNAMDPGDIDMSSDDQVRITCQLSIDKCYPVQQFISAPVRAQPGAYTGPAGGSGDIVG